MFEKINESSRSLITQSPSTRAEPRRLAAEAPWTAANDMRMIAPRNASVAQLDRVLPSEGRGRGFESRRMRHFDVEALGENPGLFRFCAIIVREAIFL